MVTRVYYNEAGDIVNSEQFVAGPDGKDLPSGGDYISVDFDLTESLLDYIVENGSLKKKPDEIVNERKYQQDLELCLLKRASAYFEESDSLYLEAEYDGDTDKQKWKDKVAEIKLRFPKP